MSSIAVSAPTPTAVSEKSRAISRSRFAGVGLATIIAAVLANTVFYYIGSVLVTYDPEFVILTGVSGTILFTVVPAIVAVLLYAALLRFTRNPARVFTVISAVVLVLSVIPDLTYIPSVEGASAGQTTILILMHVVAAAVIVWMLTTFARSRQR